MANRKDDKNKKEEKKPNTENDWEGFGYACLNNFIITLVYGLIGANFIFYVALKTQDRTNLKKKNGAPQKLNEFFRVDNEYYNCLGDPEDKECKTSCNNIPYSFYDEIDMKDVAKHTMWNRVTGMIPFVGGNEDKNGSISIVDAQAPQAPQAPAAQAPAQVPASPTEGQAPAVEGQAPASPTEGQSQAPAVEGQAPATATTEGQAPVAEAQAAAQAPHTEAQAPATEEKKQEGGNVTVSDNDKDPDFDTDCSDTPEEKCLPRKGPIDVSNMWVIGIWYVMIKDWFLESIARTYYTERNMLHSLYGSFTSKKNCGFRGNDTVKMIIGPIITTFIIAFTFLIGFFNYFVQSCLNNPIFFIAFLIIPFVPILGSLIGLQQLVEFLVKFLISPLFTSSTEIFNTISAHPLVLIFVFGALTVSSAYTYLVNEISIPMTICWGIFTIYSWWNLSSADDAVKPSTSVKAAAATASA